MVDIPTFSVQIRPSQFSTTLPAKFFIHIQRHPDIRNETCCIRWWLPQDPFRSGHFRFAHLTASGEEQALYTTVAADLEEDRYQGKPFPFRLPYKDDSQLRDMGPGANATFSIHVPAHYQKQLVSGQKYALRWQGGTIAHWVWGSKFEREKRSDKEMLVPDESLAIQLTPSEVVTISVDAEGEPWPRRAETEAQYGYATANEMEASWRSQASAREAILKELNDPEWPTKGMTEKKAGAPVLSTTIEINMPREISLSSKEPAMISLRATLHSDTPVMVSTPRLRGADFKFALGRPYPPPRQEEMEWMPFRDEDSCLAGTFFDDYPDYEVVVGDSDGFVCIQPDETWAVMTTRLPSSGDYPDLQPGDEAVVWFNGATAEWWDWGSADEHKNTKVMLCGQWSGGGVTKPMDNDGRPELLLPAAGRVTCHIME